MKICESPEAEDDFLCRGLYPIREIAERTGVNPVIASASVPVFAGGAAVAQQVAAFRAAGVEPLPLDEEAMALQLQERISA